ncbi:AraC family transcriptional regulator [Sinorhizobium meliloti]|uniref:AraC family transcriptional regulator n=1 Tax=Rhizobium meliloti TaxID=382 RepID=UPI0002A5B22C|nr:AraC family transcriptional regulator [Sinorhizobium meliloti]AGA09544.1 AraC-type DNA-binding domain-containing protein [Sinorhizobium meliloti GR4]MDE3876473.1 AraC family transcriptional regulator [Sinorhizobium meliloti]RVL06412.1 AraC family transcriptional regulator [Sinorhizobium meliloti]RVM96261.1 AraC family transcriptional regulator [Sinorhizobium meliloti]RVN12389.1 AraC family transcriptional regulator [Sinorhizobium meliloti]
MDPLSDVLSLLKPHAYVSSGFDAGGEWAVQFGDQHKLIKCYAVVSGDCWLTVGGVADAVRLVTGDCFVLPTGRPFRLGSSIDGPAVGAGEIFPAARRGGVVTLNGGGGLFLVGSRFGVKGSHADMLLGLLPPIVHIHEQPEQAALRWSVEQMMKELGEEQPGNALVAQHLAHIMLVQALRVHLDAGGSDRVGWFFSLADKQLGAAIKAIHAQPAYQWTLQELGAIAGMSRSTFALRFKKRVGEPPMQYVARWRMLLACDRLENSSDPVATVAASLGYESESAFSTAFKRVMGCSPRQYGRFRKADSETSSIAANSLPHERRSDCDNGSRRIQHTIAVAAPGGRLASDQRPASVSR